ncbi:MAG TPA: hypothetical protein VIU15_15160 [Streptomyces sp.]
MKHVVLARRLAGLLSALAVAAVAYAAVPAATGHHVTSGTAIASAPNDDRWG